MLFRALLSLIVACPAFGAQQEIMFDGEKIVVPDLPGLEFVDPQDDWYKERAKILADDKQFYVILHGDEHDLCLQLFVMRDKKTKAGTVTTLNQFKKGYQYEKGVKHLTDRLWLYQTTDRGLLAAHMLCSGKVVICMLSRFRNENGINKKMLPTTEEDERRFLAWCQALIAANPALTPKQQKDADNADRLDLIFVLIVGAALFYYLVLKLRETRAKAEKPWAFGNSNGL
jgi:hypothetical protein